MRILITENDLLSRTTLEKMLSLYSSCQTAGSGSQAAHIYLQSMKYPPIFDAILLNIDMKDDDPVNVINKIRDLENRSTVTKAGHTKIIIMTNRVNKDVILKCVQAGCNAVLVKPFSRETLKQKFIDVGLPLEEKKTKKQSVFNVHDIAEELYQRFLSNELSLPAQPQTIMKFKELRMIDASWQQIEEILRHDISISATLIKVANSAMFGGQSRFKTLAQAMQRLGLDETEHYVTAIINKRLYENLPRVLSHVADELWEHSLACAYTLTAINKKLDEPLEVDAFTLGLLHDIGKLLLLQVFSEIAKQKKDPSIVQSDDFFELVSSDMHEKFGAAMLEKWEFPLIFHETILHHENPMAVEKLTQEVAAIYVADKFVKSMGYTINGEEPQKFDRDQAKKLLDISYDELEELSPSIKSSVKAAISVI